MFFREESDGSCMEESVMPRLARLPSVPFGWYYVALHSVTGRKIVTSRADLKTLLKLLRVALQKKGARLHAGYVTEREAHLVLQAGEGPLSAITGSFKHQYARLFNRTHEENGSLFRLHHHVLLFQHQRWLVPLVHYIHWIGRLEAPDDDQAGVWWSSDAVYRGSGKQGWVTTNVVLRMLTRGAYSRQVREKAYVGLFDQVPESNHAQLFRHGSAEDPRLLGDAQFIGDMWRQTGRRSPDRGRHARHLEGDISGAVMQVIEHFNALCDERRPHQAATWRRIATYDNVRSRSRKRPLPMIRALSAAYLIEHEIATAAQAARFFGSGPRSVSTRRRRSYQELFLKWFGAMPQVLLNPGRDGDWSSGRANDHIGKVLECEGRSEFSYCP
jgi:hypothetical protein